MNEPSRVTLSLDTQILQRFIERMKFEYHLKEYEEFLDDLEEQLAKDQTNSHSTGLSTGE